MNLHGGANRGLEIVALGLGRVEDLDRERAAGHHDHWRILPVLGELARVESGGHDENVEVGAAQNDLLEEAKENVGGERALVSLVQNDDGVAIERRIGHGLAQQHTVSHVGEHGALRGGVVEAHVVAALLAQSDVHLVSDTLRNGHGGNTARLRARHALATAHRGVEQELRNLSRFARASFTNKNNSLILFNFRNDFLFK
jgi:hypothetical protein